MKQLILSIILGIVFPVACFTAIGFSTDYYLPGTVWSEIRINGAAAPGILFAPFSIPIYADIYLQESRIAPYIFDTFWFRVSTIISFNWLLYGLIFYWLLGRRKNFGKRKIEFQEPPSPPSF